MFRYKKQLFDEFVDIISTLILAFAHKLIIWWLFNFAFNCHLQLKYDIKINCHFHQTPFYQIIGPTHLVLQAQMSRIFSWHQGSKVDKKHCTVLVVKQTLMMRSMGLTYSKTRCVGPLSTAVNSKSTSRYLVGDCMIVVIVWVCVCTQRILQQRVIRDINSVWWRHGKTNLTDPSHFITHSALAKFIILFNIHTPSNAFYISTFIY